MTEKVDKASRIFLEIIDKLQQIPSTDRGISFERNARRVSLTVHGKTAEALMFILDHVDQMAADVREITKAMETILPPVMVIPPVDQDFYDRVRRIVDSYSAKAAILHVEEMTSSGRRIAELLEANNRYQQEARDARAELKAHKEKHGHGN